MSANRDTPEAELAAELAAFDDALRGGNGMATADHSGMGRAQDCLRLLEQVWPRHANNVPTMLREALAQPPTPAPMTTPTISVPASIGRFQVLRELGRGGFGIVYLAHDPALHRHVALKIPRSDVTLTPELRRRFQHEAQAAAGLDHPNVVPVYLAKLGHDLRNQPGMSKTGRDVLQEVLSYYRAILSEHSNNPEVRFQTAIAGHRVGITCHAFGEWAECESAFREAIQLLEQLLADQPKEPKYEKEFANTLVQFANALRDQHKHQQSSDVYERAVRFADAALAEDPGNAFYLSFVANAILNWCVPLLAERRFDEVESHYQRVIELQRPLHAQNPKSVYLALEFALGLDDYGDLLLTLGRPAAAEALLKADAPLREELRDLRAEAQALLASAPR